MIIEGVKTIKEYLGMYDQVFKTEHTILIKKNNIILVSQHAGSQELGDEEFHKTGDFTYKWGIQRTAEHMELLLHMTFNNQQETWGRTDYK